MRGVEDRDKSSRQRCGDEESAIGRRSKKKGWEVERRNIKGYMNIVHNYRKIIDLKKHFRSQ
jgi:hypothetical protein